jgi:hypothetical protein
LKISSIKTSGLREFSAWYFTKNEFVTCYLGVLDLAPQDITYTFKKINGAPRTSNGGLVGDNWFGHWIQHGSGDKVNVVLTEEYIIKTCKHQDL